MNRLSRRWWLVGCLLLGITGCGSKVELYSNLKAQDANEMLALLLRNGIAAEKTVAKGGATIVVPSQAVPEATDLLRNAGLPHDQFTTLGDLFQKSGMISSPTEERVRYLYGTTQELSRTLSGIDGVLSARVHIVMPDDSADGRPMNPSSAAVLIRYAAGANLDAIVPKIKELVANSIQGLSYDKVSVILVKAAPEDIAPALAMAAKSSKGNVPPALLYGLIGGLAISVIGNIALAFLLWRGRLSPGAAVSATP